MLKSRVLNTVVSAGPSINPTTLTAVTEARNVVRSFSVVFRAMYASFGFGAHNRELVPLAIA